MFAYAKLGCACLQLQASSHCTRWHELCDDGKFVQTRAECKLVYIMPSAAEFRSIQSFSLPKEYSTKLKTEEFSTSRKLVSSSCPLRGGGLRGVAT